MLNKLDLTDVFWFVWTTSSLYSYHLDMYFCGTHDDVLHSHVFLLYFTKGLEHEVKKQSHIHYIFSAFSSFLWRDLSKPTNHSECAPALGWVMTDCPLCAPATHFHLSCQCQCEPQLGTHSATNLLKEKGYSEWDPFPNLPWGGAMWVLVLAPLQVAQISCGGSFCLRWH